MAYDYTETVESILFELIDPDDDAAIALIRAKLDLGWGLVDIFQVVQDYKTGSLGGATGTLLVGAINSSVTTFVTSVSSWPPTPFDVVIDNERMTVTARNAGTFTTVTRGVGGTTAASHANNSMIVLVPTSTVTSVQVTGGSPLTGVVTIPAASGATAGTLSAANFTKLGGIATGATVNSTDAQLRDRSTHTGTQSADTLTDGTTNKAFLATERTKLSGIATGATANSTDAFLRALGNATGTLSADSVVDGITNKAYTGTEQTKLAGLPATAVSSATFSSHTGATDGSAHTATGVSVANLLASNNVTILYNAAGLQTVLQNMARDIGASVPVTDHGALGGLTDDDHTQYHTDARGDVRYYTKTAVDAFDADKWAESATRKWLTSAERTKLSGIATGATANQTDAFLKDLANSTGTLDANKIVDNVGTLGTDGRKYTKADKDKLTAIPAGNLATAQNLTDHKNATGTTEHQAEAVAVPVSTHGSDTVFSIPVDTDVQPFLSWTNDTALHTVIDQLAAGAALDNILSEIHFGATTGVHGIPNTGLLVSKLSSGVRRISTATSPPAVGANPPSGSVDEWVENNELHFRNNVGNEVVLTPSWKQEYVRLTPSDVVVTSSVTLVDCLVCPNNLVAQGEYLIWGDLYYLAAATTGGLRLGWTGLSGAAFDWQATGIGIANTGTSRADMTMTTQHGTAATVLSNYGGQGTGARLPLRFSGRLKMSATPDAPILQIAQHSSSATSTTVKVNSWMKIERVS